MQLRPVGRRAVLVELESLAEVHRLWRAVQAHRPEGLESVVAGGRTLLLTFRVGVAADPLVLASQLPESRPTPGRAGSVTIRVVYGGPDLDDVADRLGMSTDEVVARHSSATYTVGFLGFSPGFAYLFGGDPGLAVPRRPTPRTTVAAGSVALAGDMTAVYPQATPGGWNLIGRTDEVMFDPSRSEPALLSPGDEVRFEAVQELPSAPAPPMSVPLRRPGPGQPAFEVLEPGWLLTVQDRGRPGWGHAGVPVAGAADLGSAERANWRAGNPAGAAVLESTGGGCRLRLRADRVVAVTGADADLAVDGIPARMDAGLPLRSGAELVVGRCRLGLRVYVAMAGGLDVEEVLGSRATDTLSGLGPAPLRAGDLVGLGRPGSGGDRPAAVPSDGSGWRSALRPDGSVEVGGRLGPRHDRLSPGGLDSLSHAEFVVGAASDRTGVRLDGATVGLVPAGDLASEGMVAGAVQIPPGGRPIVLMRNHPPTGGYPVVAVVDESGVDALAQAAPGTRVRFRISAD